MTKPRVSQAVTRPTRTAVQGGPAYVLVLFWDTFVGNLSDKEFGVAVLAVTVVLGAIQTAVENKRGKGFLRDVPPKTDRVP